jgi:hypothetical protein
MYIKQGEEIPNSNDVQAMPAWNNGLVYRVGKDIPGFFCEIPCTYTLLVKTEIEGTYEIQAKSSVSEQVLPNYEEIFDFVSYKQTLCYKFNVVGDTFPISIRITPYMGNPDLYVHPGDGPESGKLEDFAFNSTQLNSEELNI